MGKMKRFLGIGGNWREFVKTWEGGIVGFLERVRMHHS